LKERQTGGEFADRDLFWLTAGVKRQRTPKKLVLVHVGLVHRVKLASWLLLALVSLEIELIVAVDVENERGLLARLEGGGYYHDLAVPLAIQREARMNYKVNVCYKILKMIIIHTLVAILPFDLQWDLFSELC